MSQYAVGTFVTLVDRNGGVRLQVQNFAQGRVKQGFVYGAFGYSGAVADGNGASISSSLVFAHSELLLNMLKTACDERWLCRVKTSWLDPQSYAETGIFSFEIYAVLNFSHDLETVSLSLGSPLDAIAEQVPRRVLTRWMVGQLPTTGNVSLR